MNKIEGLSEDGFTVGTYTGSGEESNGMLGEGTYYYTYRLRPRSWFSSHFCLGCVRQSILTFLWRIPILGCLVFRDIGFKPDYVVIKRSHD